MRDAAILACMKAGKQKPTEGLVLLGQAGYSKLEVDVQVHRLCTSPDLENQDLAREILRFLVAEALAGRVPYAEDVAAHLGKRDFGPGDSYVRTPKLKLLEGMGEYYEVHAKPNDIYLEIPQGTYTVFARRREDIQSDHVGPTVASIIEPSDLEEVYRAVPVRGRIDLLDPDLRAWLVVLVFGTFYPQCRVSRRSPSWQYEVRVGQVQWGSLDGTEFTVQLVATDIEGDCVFWTHLKTRGLGVGMDVLPPDAKVLDAKRVIRRDIRPDKPTA